MESTTTILYKDVDHLTTDIDNFLELRCRDDQSVESLNTARLLILYRGLKSCKAVSYIVMWRWVKEMLRLFQ